MACENLVERLKTLAASRLEASEEDIAFADAKLAIVGTDRQIAMRELVSSQPDRTVRATGETEAPFCFPNGCYVSEVEIDPETGEIRIDRFHGVDDAGRIVSLPIVHGQTHGGLAQGIGQATLEEIRYDPRDGQLLTGSLMDYALPRASDLPGFETQLDQEEATGTNLLGVKGAGESGAVRRAAGGRFRGAGCVARPRHRASRHAVHVGECLEVAPRRKTRREDRGREQAADSRAGTLSTTPANGLALRTRRW